MSPHGFDIPNICRKIPGNYFGGEAVVDVYLLNSFPGIGGLIKTARANAVAVRKENATAPGTGNATFLLHLLLKKLEDFFRHWEQSRYINDHIPRPFGSISQENSTACGKIEAQNEVIREASIYEWAFGHEGFSWYYSDAEGEKKVELKEWDEFISSFEEAGISMTSDICDGEAGGKCSKNIICKLPMPGTNDWMNECWVRIDFGQPKSLYVDRERLGRFLYNKASRLENCLGIYRSEMLQLAYKRLFERNSMTDREQGWLDHLVRDFRRSSLRHLDAYIISI